jgi:hypothetical protein
MSSSICALIFPFGYVVVPAIGVVVVPTGGTGRHVATVGLSSSGAQVWPGLPGDAPCAHVSAAGASLAYSMHRRRCAGVRKPFRE